VSKIAYHHFKLNLWTMSLRLYNRVAEIIWRRTLCECSK